MRFMEKVRTAEIAEGAEGMGRSLWVKQSVGSAYLAVSKENSWNIEFYMTAGFSVSSASSVVKLHHAGLACLQIGSARLPRAHDKSICPTAAERTKS